MPMTQIWRDRPTLRASGWTTPQIDAALRRRTHVSVVRGILLPREASEAHPARCAAALATQRADAAVSHRDAALLHGWRWCPQTWRDPRRPVDVTAARDDLTRSARAGINRCLAALPEQDVIDVGGLRVTTPARTAVDLARTQPRLLAVQLMDAALRAEQCTAPEMRDVTDRMIRVPGVRLARAAIDQARAGVDSPAETTARLQIVADRLPEPDVRLEITTDGVLEAVGDLGYWRWLIWIEYDGWEWHSSHGVFRSDRVRDRWLARRGWETFRLTDDDVASPGNYLSQLRNAIEDAPRRILAMRADRSPEVAAAQATLRPGRGERS